MVFRRTLPFILTFLFALIPQSILAQQKIPIELIIISDDTVGNKLVNRIKEDIQRSDRFEITSNIELPRLKLTIVTLDPYKTKVSTIYILLMVASEVYFTDIFISSNVGVCGLGKIKDVSHKMLADIDKNTELFNKSKKDWDSFEEYLRISEHKLIEQVNDLQNKTNELEEKLNKEKAKSWWKKLKETIQSRFYLSISDLAPRN
jgi:hypothetical protein